MLRAIPITVSLIYLCGAVLWLLGGVSDLPIPFVDPVPAVEDSTTSLSTRLDQRLSEAPVAAFVAGAVVCAVLLLMAPWFARLDQRRSAQYAVRARSQQTPTPETPDTTPLLPGPRLSIEAKIERLKEIRRATREGDTASMKAVRLHQRILERAGRFEHD